MTTPRPLGVRRANVVEEQIVKRLTSLPALLVKTGLILYKGRSSSGFAALAFARSAQPHCPRLRTRANPYRGLALSARATSQAGDR